VLATEYSKIENETSAQKREAEEARKPKNPEKQYKIGEEFGKR
jgi:hypothetical protein